MVERDMDWPRALRGVGEDKSDAVSALRAILFNGLRAALRDRTDVGEASAGQTDRFRRDSGRITIEFAMRCAAKYCAGRGADYGIGGQREQNHQERNQQTSHNSSGGIAAADWPYARERLLRQLDVRCFGRCDTAGKSATTAGW